MRCPECNYTIFDTCCHQYGKYHVWYWGAGETSVHTLNPIVHILYLPKLVKMSEDKIEKLLVLV
jgi:hypothetical protein